MVSLSKKPATIGPVSSPVSYVTGEAKVLSPLFNKTEIFLDDNDVE